MGRSGPAAQGSRWRPHPEPLRAAGGLSLIARFKTLGFSLVRRARRFAQGFFRAARDEVCRRCGASPIRPSAMCDAQRVDFIAACEGKITWRQYFAKWGEYGPTL
jgi:hypothetical protein